MNSLHIATETNYDPTIQDESIIPNDQIREKIDINVSYLTDNSSILKYETKSCEYEINDEENWEDVENKIFDTKAINSQMQYLLDRKRQVISKYGFQELNDQIHQVTFTPESHESITFSARNSLLKKNDDCKFKYLSFYVVSGNIKGECFINQILTFYFINNDFKCLNYFISDPINISLNNKLEVFDSYRVSVSDKHFFENLILSSVEYCFKANIEHILYIMKDKNFFDRVKEQKEICCNLFTLLNANSNLHNNEINTGGSTGKDKNTTMNENPQYEPNTGDHEKEIKLSTHISTQITTDEGDNPNIEPNSEENDDKKTTNLSENDIDIGTTNDDEDTIEEGKHQDSEEIGIFSRIWKFVRDIFSIKEIIEMN